MADKITHGDSYTSSDESNLAEIGLGKAEGAAYGAALQYLAKREASDSGVTTIGDYVVGYSIEEAEGLYHMRNGQLEWHEPREENCHLEIVVRNAADGRFIPCLTVRATLTDDAGTLVGSHEIPFLWHPWIYHYGRNWVMPHDGKYHLHIQVEQPTFSRHDKKNGHRFATAIDADFDINIKTGRKLTEGREAA